MRIDWLQVSFVVVVVGAVLAHTGCTDLKQAIRTDQAQPWLTAPHRYECDDASMDRVHEETKVCTEATEHKGVYCYGAAFIRNCSLPVEY